MFKIHKTACVQTSSLFDLPVTTSEAVTLGETLKMASGALTLASGTNAVEYIAMSSCTAGSGNIIKVARVYENEEYETTFSADGSSIVEGDKVTVESTGLTVTATTSSGVFYVTKKLGTGASGTHVIGMFRR